MNLFFVHKYGSKIIDTVLCRTKYALHDAKNQISIFGVYFTMPDMLKIINILCAFYRVRHTKNQSVWNVIYEPNMSGFSMSGMINLANVYDPNWSLTQT